MTADHCTSSRKVVMEDGRPWWPWCELAAGHAGMHRRTYWQDSALLWNDDEAWPAAPERRHGRER